VDRRSSTERSRRHNATSALRPKLLEGLPWGLSEPIVRRLRGSPPGAIWVYRWAGASFWDGRGGPAELVLSPWQKQPSRNTETHSRTAARPPPPGRRRRCSVRVEGDEARTWRAMLRREAADPATRRRFPRNRRPRGEKPLRWPAPSRRSPNRDRSAPRRPRSVCASVCHRANAAGA